MGKSILIATVLIMSAGCASSSTVIIPNPYIYTTQENKVARHVILVMDQGVNDISRVLSPKSPVCGQSAFTIQNGSALAESIRQTTEGLYEKVTVHNELPSTERPVNIKADGFLHVKLDRYMTQMLFSGSSKMSRMLDARITGEIVIKVAIKSMDGQDLYTTEVGSFHVIDHAVGVCEHGAADLSEVISKTIRETTEKYALALVNFERNGTGGAETQRAGNTKKTAPDMPANTSEVLKDPLTGMELILLNGGFFQMGDISNDGYPEERPLHQVYLKSFYISKFEVTQGLWKDVMGDNPSKFPRGDAYPVENVSWDEARDFIVRLNKKTGGRYRLPSEAEWEYAARSGGKSEKWAGTSKGAELEMYAWYEKNSGGGTHEAGTKKPNGAGLYDMSGNVEEWVEDSFGARYYEASPRENPLGPDEGTDRVYRGGSWANSSDAARTSNRGREHPAKRYPTIGFRLVLPHEPE